MSTALVALVSATALTLGMASTAAFAGDGRVKSIVLVHGGFVDGSGWEGVYDILKKDGYDVTSSRIRRSPSPMTSLLRSELSTPPRVM